jgi:putative tricarboxylic transport membrane protein
MYIGNRMLLVLNLPLIPMWVKVLKVPYDLLYLLILLLIVPIITQRKKLSTLEEG